MSSEEYVSTQVPNLEREIGNEEPDETPIEPPPRIQLPGFRKASDLSRLSLSSSSRPTVAQVGHVDLTEEGEETISNKNPLHNIQKNQAKQYKFKSPMAGEGEKRIRIGLGASSSRPTVGNKNNGNQVKGAFKPPTFKVPERPIQGVAPDSPDSPSIPTEPLQQEIVDIDSSENDSDNLNEIPPATTAKSSTDIVSAKMVPAPQNSGSSGLAAVKINPLGTKKREVFYPAAPQKEKLQEAPASDDEVEDLMDAVKKSRQLREARTHSHGRSGGSFFVASAAQN